MDKRKHADQSLAYYYRNRKSCLIRCKNYYNLRKKEINRRKREKRKLGFWPKIKIKIKKELGLKCKRCGIEKDNPTFFDLDHIHRGKFVRLGDIKNYQVLCPNCHREKTIENREYFR